VNAPHFPAGWLPINAAAQALGLRPATLRTWCQLGVVPSESRLVISRHYDGFHRATRYRLVDLEQARQTAAAPVRPPSELPNRPPREVDPDEHRVIPDLAHRAAAIRPVPPAPPSRVNPLTLAPADACQVYLAEWRQIRRRWLKRRAA
jgi:hypothetical protein